MTTITEAQRVALVKAADALWDKAEDFDYYGPYCIIRDLLDHATIEAEAAPTLDASPLWRDSDREDWMRDDTIRLELVYAPYITVGINPAGIESGDRPVVIEDADETVAVSPEHLPALIAMLQEVQRRIEAGDAL